MHTLEYWVINNGVDSFEKKKRKAEVSKKYYEKNREKLMKRQKEINAKHRKKNVN